MQFKLFKNKEKLKINTVKSNTNDNERTREKFILKGWIESNRKPTCTNKRTRGFLCRLHKLVLNGKMTFSCPTTCTDSYTRRENRCQIPFKTSLTRFKMDFSAGRSMVEMLGVLAIIGVLSIGGISGYTIAMRRYRVNEIVQSLNKYALIVYDNFQNQLINNPTLATIDEKPNYRDTWYKDISHFYYCPDKQTDRGEGLSCLRNNNVSFVNSGLGGLPQGITEITPYTIAIAKNGSTVLLFRIDFEQGNQELCNQINQTLGDQYKSDENDNNRCEYFPPQLTNGIVIDTSH